jgi:hypothetical protein
LGSESNEIYGMRVDFEFFMTKHTFSFFEGFLRVIVKVIEMLTEAGAEAEAEAEAEAGAEVRGWG